MASNTMASKLNEEDILECFKSLNVEVKLNDLSNPTKEFMFRVFSTFLRDLQIEVNSSILKPWEATSHMESSEIYEDGLMLLLLIKAMNSITQYFNITITLKDILEPKPKRTKKILNYLLIFWTNYLKNLSHFQSIEDCLKADQKKIQDVQNENELLYKKYTDIKEYLNNVQPTKRELFEAIEIEKEKIKELNICKEKQTNEYQLLKSKEADLRSNLGSLNLRLVSAKEKLEELDNFIVNSPDRVDSEIQKLKERIKEVDMKLKETENKIKKLKTNIDDYNKHFKELETIDEIVNGIIKDVQMTWNNIKCLDSLKIKQEQENKNLADLQAQAEQIKDKINKLKNSQAKANLTTLKQKEKITELIACESKKLTTAKQDAKFAEIKCIEVESEFNSAVSELMKIKEVYLAARKEGKVFEDAHLKFMEKKKNEFYSEYDEFINNLKDVYE